MKSSVCSWFVISTVAAAALTAQTVDSLKGAFERESQLLEVAIDDYNRGRSQERDAIRDLRQLAEQLDTALGDPNVTVDYLTDLEARMAAARSRACTSLELTAQARGRIYDRMQRVAAAAREFEDRADLFGLTQEGLAGTWHLEVQPLDLYGLMNLRVSGSQVSGPYRLSNGRRGSISGTLSGNSLSLRLTDSEEGVIGDVDAELDVAAGEIRGTWTTLELARGRPSTGAWLADKVSSREAIDLEE